MRAHPEFAGEAAGLRLASPRRSAARISSILFSLHPWYRDKTHPSVADMLAKLHE